MWHSYAVEHERTGLAQARPRRQRRIDKRHRTRLPLVLERLEDRCLPSFTLGALVQAAPTDLLAACKPGNQVGVFFPDTQVVEPRLAVDPTNSNHMVGAWQQERWDNGGSFGIVAGVTFDAGKTWSAVMIPGLTGCSGGPFDRASDPWVTFGPTGTVYVSSLGLSGNEDTGVTESAILVNRSTDGGLTWSPPATLIESGKGFLNDKEAITADLHDPNLVYAVWDQPNLSFPRSGAGGQTFFARSSDGGQTWSAPRVIFQSPGVDTSVGHQILVLPNGTLVDAFEELHFDSSTSTVSNFLDILRSSDGGSTWSQPIVAAQEMPAGVDEPFNRIFVRSGTGLPEVAVDPANGNLDAVWEDGRFGSFPGQFESIAFSISTDGGSTWSTPIQVNQTPTNLSAPFDSSAFTPSIAVGGDGTVAVTYYDFRNQGTSPGAATDHWTVFGNPKGSGGLTNTANWGNELRLTASSFNILNAPIAGGWFLGDYEGLPAAGSNFEAFFSQAGALFPQAHIFARQILDGSGSWSSSPSAAKSTSSVPVAGPISAAVDPLGFLAPVSYPVDKGPIAAVVGDFSNDRIPDLVVANQSSSDVSVLLGNGNGTFQPGKTVAVGNTPRALAVGDFNGDGKLDIVTANSHDITVLFGKGDGTFKSPPLTLTLPNVIANQVPQAPLSVAVGDFNHDGKLDLVVTAKDSVFFAKGYANVFLGNGDGTFTLASVTPVSSSTPISVALTDFNGDGNLDVVTGNSMDLALVPGGGGISVLLGKGDGTLQETTAVYPDVSFLPMAVAVGDFNGDHIPDLVVTGFTNIGGSEQSAVSVLLGNGNGTFQAPRLFPVGGLVAIQAVTVADVNGDGKPDIITATSGAVSVLLGNGNGTFQAPLNFSAPFGAPFADVADMAVGDFNGDGRADLAVTDFFANSVAVLINSGSWPALASTATTMAPALTTSASPAIVLTGSAGPSSQANSPAVLTVSDSAPSETRDLRAALFWADIAGVDQLFLSLVAEGPMAASLATQPPALDGWVDQALTDVFSDPFKTP